MLPEGALTIERVRVWTPDPHDLLHSPHAETRCTKKRGSALRHIDDDGMMLSFRQKKAL